MKASTTEHQETAREPPKRSRRTQVLLALLTAWALFASGLLAWQAISPGLAPAVWDSDATILQDAHFGFSNADYVLGEYLTTQQWRWGDQGVRWIEEIFGVVRRGESSPAGFPSGTTLNLTLVNLGCSLSGMSYVVRVLRDYPSAWNATVWNSTLTYRGYVSQTEQVYANVSMSLSGVHPTGRDPLAQIGPAGVAKVRSQLGRL
jgi:hypothetical protein